MEYRFLAGIIYIFFTVVLFFFVKEENRFELDSYVYERVALQFFKNNKLNDPIQKDVMPTISVGYPLFLGLIYKCFGHRPIYAIIFQMLLVLLIICLIYKIAEQFFGETVACYSAVLASINIGFLTYTQFLLTEVLLISFLLSFIYFFLNFLKLQNSLDLFTSAFFLAVSLIIKPVALFFVFVPLIILVFTQQSFNLFFIKKITLFLLPFIFVGSAITYHNFKMYNCIAFTRAGHENIFRYFLPRVIAKDKKMSLSEAEKMVDNHLTIEKNYSQNLYDILSNYIIHKPLLCMKIWFFNVFKTFFGLHYTALKVLLNDKIKGGSCAYFNMPGGFLNKIYGYIFYGLENKLLGLVAVYEIFMIFIQFFGLLFSLFFLIKEKKFIYVFLVGSFILYFALVTGHDGFGRYRMLFEPFLIISAAYLLEFALKKFQRRRICEVAT